MENNQNNQLNRGRCNKSYTQHPAKFVNKNENSEFEPSMEDDWQGATFPQNKNLHEDVCNKKKTD